MNTTSRCLLLSLALLLAACDKSPQNPAPAAAPASAAAPVASTAPVPTTAPAATSAPAATTAPAAGTSAAPSDASDNGPEIAGSVAVAQGSVTDTAKDGSVRQLKDDDNVYPGDSFVVGPDSYLDLDLEDTGRILLRPNTTFQITSYHFEPAAHDPNGPTDANGQPLIKPQQPENAFFKLVKGGLRAVDGLIGHSSPQNYGVETPVATIGVRGTAFDVRYCGDDCADEADASGKPENGLYTSVTDGTVDVKNDDGDVVTPAGHSGYVKSRKQRMQALKTPPKALRHMSLPDKLKARAEKNRSQIHVRRQQRRQRMLERRRQAAAQRAKAGGQPAATQPKTPQARREQRQEEKQGKTQAPAGKAARQEERQQRREDREQKQTASPGAGKPAAAGGTPARERGVDRQQLRQDRQQRRQEKQQGDAAATKPDQPKADQPSGGKQDQDRCKAKRKKKEKGKDKDKCSGG